MDTPQIPGFTLQSLYNKSVKTVTWSAFQQSLARRVCVHLLRPEFAAQPAECDHFLHIARAIAKNQSAAFPAIYDVVAAPPPYILLEHINDRDLAAWARQNGPLPAPALLDFAEALAQPFSGLWQNARFVARNLKPRNIRLNDNGQPHVTAFDTAVCAGAPELHDDALTGTPSYLAPEQITHLGAVDCRADIYSLGATLYFLASGHEPFSELSPEEALDAQIHDQLPCPENLPAPVATLLGRMLMKDPARRYADWEELLADLRRVRENQPLPPLPADALSTLAAPKPAPVAPAAATKPATARVTVSRDRFDAISGQGKPRRRKNHALRFILWLALGIWFALLANDRMGKPIDLGFSIPPLTTPAVNAIKQKFGKAPHVQNASTNTVNSAGNSTNYPGQATGTPDPPPGISPVENAPPITPPQPPPVPPFSDARLAALVAALRENNAVEFRRLLETPDPGGVPAQLAQARELYDRHPAEDALLTAAVTLQKNKTITLRHQGTDRQIKILDAADGSLVILSLADNRELSIPFARLDPAERRRLMLLVENTTDAANLTLALSAHAAGDLATLRRLAPRCGALAPVLLRLAE